MWLKNRWLLSLDMTPDWQEKRNVIPARKNPTFSFYPWTLACFLPSGSKPKIVLKSEGVCNLNIFVSFLDFGLLMVRRFQKVLFKTGHPNFQTHIFPQLQAWRLPSNSHSEISYLCWSSQLKTNQWFCSLEWNPDGSNLPKIAINLAILRYSHL